MATATARAGSTEWGTKPQKESIPSNWLWVETFVKCLKSIFEWWLCCCYSIYTWRFLVRARSWFVSVLISANRLTHIRLCFFVCLFSVFISHSLLRFRLFQLDLIQVRQKSRRIQKWIWIWGVHGKYFRHETHTANDRYILRPNFNCSAVCPKLNGEKMGLTVRHKTSKTVDKWTKQNTHKTNKMDGENKKRIANKQKAEKWCSRLIKVSGFKRWHLTWNADVGYPSPTPSLSPPSHAIAGRFHCCCCSMLLNCFSIVDTGVFWMAWRRTKCFSHYYLSSSVLSERANERVSECVRLPLPQLQFLSLCNDGYHSDDYTKIKTWRIFSSVFCANDSTKIVAQRHQCVWTVDGNA